MDLLDWETRLRELASQGAESTWPDPQLQQSEDNILERASGEATAWMVSLWPYVRDLLKQPSESQYRRVERHSDDDPINVEKVSHDISNVISIADKRAKHIDKLPEKAPWISVPEGPHEVHVPKLHKAAEWMARQSAASKMREWADGMREDVRWQTVQAIREGITADALAKRLEERWDHHGQHFQLIAVTEMASAYNDAMLYHLAGQHVVIPVIGDDKVCKECKKLLEGKVFYVSPTPLDNPTKREREQYLWVGKSNIGRSAKDYQPCLPLHPRCRHVAVKYRGGDPYDYHAPKR